MIKNLENKLKFIELVDKMKDIERIVYLKNGRKETDAEHSFHLAIMAMIFLEDFPELDQLKCLRMCLLHDIIEIFAGDTILFGTSEKNTQENKQEREKKALLQLEEVLGKEDFKSFKDVIHEYESRVSEEAQFVYQLDKLHPIIQIVMEGGDIQKEWKVTQEMREAKDKKVFNDKFGFDLIAASYMKIAIEKDMFYKK